LKKNHETLDIFPRYLNFTTSSFFQRRMKGEFFQSSDLNHQTLKYKEL